MDKLSLQKHIYKRFVATVRYFLFLLPPSFLPSLFFLLFFPSVFLSFSFLCLFFYFPSLFFYFSFLIFFPSPPSPPPPPLFFLSLSFPLLPSFFFFFPGGRRKVQLLLQTVHSQSTGTAGTEENGASSLPAWVLNNDLDQLQSRTQESSASSTKGFVDVSHKQQNKQRCSGLAYLCSKHSPWLNKKAPMN